MQKNKKCLYGEINKFKHQFRILQPLKIAVWIEKREHSRLGDPRRYFFNVLTHTFIHSRQEQIGNVSNMAGKQPSSPSGFSVDSRGKYKDMEGYIHKVSDVKVPPLGLRYFDFKVQERDECRRVVCFFADKWQEVKEKENSKAAVSKAASLSPRLRSASVNQTLWNTDSKTIPK